MWNKPKLTSVEVIIRVSFVFAIPYDIVPEIKNISDKLTTVTKYCSSNCRKIVSKRKKQTEKVKRINRVTRRKASIEKVAIKDKEFLSVNDVALLLNCTNRTVYHLIKTEKLKATNLGVRVTRIKRSNLDKLFSN